MSEQIAKLEKGIRVELINQSHLLYENLHTEYNKAITETNNKLQLVNAKINEWLNLLSEKRSNPFVNPEVLISDTSVFNNFNIELENLETVFEKHNKISQSHSELAQNAKKKIEYHFVSQLAAIEKLDDVEREFNDSIIKIEAKTDAAKTLVDIIKNLEDELRSDTLAIDEININLHKFLGRNDIVLYRQEEGGYQLKRNGITARNLSEGEKTAISLIYFFSKIQENDALIANQIIILDDPISSFDSNHLFNASSLIKKSTRGAKQIFVLTHNFWFFKQVRDWMKDKNKKSKDGLESNKANFYVTKAGELFDAQSTLTQTHSEYQFVFNSILQFQNTQEISIAHSFNLANSVRRMLESFSSFKTASNAGFNAALQLGIDKGFDSQQKERIYYFLNKYSHLDRIESFDNTIEPLVEEGVNVVNDVLSLIKKIDEDHYNCMLKACGYEDQLVNII